ncbi:MAG: hypothetical protein JXR61_03720 [Prolixibacteraceae bacterium]|nr:hypothetical protein [Prolixibacteraceae bacterium]
MKKIVIIIDVVIVLVIGAVIAIPVFFKPALLNATRNTLNKELNAQVDFNDFSISLFRHFPNVDIKLIKLSVIGEGEFAKDTLLNVSSVQATMSLSSIFKKSGRGINELIIINPQMNFIVAESGADNWSIVKEPGTAVSDTTPESNGGFEFQLEKIKIENATIVYEDKTAPMKLVFAGVNFDVSGNMYGSSADLKLEGKVNDFLLNYSGSDYISHVSLETNTALDVDYENMIFTISENEFLINRLPLVFSGNIKMPADTIFFDLNYKTSDSGFGNFLALVPPEYESYLEDITTDGTASVNGMLNGFYFGEDYPGFDLNAIVQNGSFQMSDLPEKINNIRAQIEVTKPQGDLDLTTVSINEAHAEIRNNPVDLTLNLKNLFSDIYFDGMFAGKVDFKDLKNTLPMDSVNLSGTVDANLTLQGNYSSIENEAYDKIKSDGVVLLDGFIYESSNLTQPVYVPVGRLEFTPRFITLKECNLKVGQSDFNLTGKVGEYLNYFLKDGTLTGEMQLNSNFVDLNEILMLQNEQPVTEENSDAEILAFNVPENLDLIFRSAIQQAVINEIPLSNINGVITVKNGIVNMQGLNMNTLGGTVNLNGSYQNTQQNRPLFDFGFDIARIDISTTYQTLTSFQKIVPLAASSVGQLSSKFTMTGQLTPDHKIIGRSLNGSGSFGSSNLKISDSPLFNQLQGILKPDKLRNVTIDDFNAAFEIENGNMDLKPFKTKIADQEATIFGSLSAENLLNMKLEFNVKRDAFGPDIQNILSILPGNEKITVLPAGVIIEGPVNNPEVKMDLSETQKAITDATKGELKNSLDKLKDGLNTLFK